MKNKYEIRGDITAIFIPRKGGSFIECLVDTKNLPLVDKFPTTWFEHCNSKNTSYVRTIVTIEGKLHRIQMHRLIMNADEEVLVDHRDHNGMNNLESNLRIATRSQNNQNKKSARSDSKTSVRGVTFDKESNKFKAHIAINGKQKTLGRFTDIEDAKKAVIEARKEHMPFSEG